MRRRRKSLILGILLILFGLGIGYAFLNTTLNINGVAEVDSNTWNIYWDNVEMVEGSVETEGTPYISEGTTVDFYVPLSKPGDYYEFTIDAENDGSMDAMVDVVTKLVNNGTTVPNYLNYTVTYDDDTRTPIQPKQLLKSNSLETYRVRVEYRTDISSGDLLSNPESLTLTFGVTYVQADSSAQLTRNYLYEVWKDSSSGVIGMTIGQPIPEGAVYYYKYQDLLNATMIGVEGGESLSRIAFFKHILENNVVTETYLAFVMNDQLYLLRGGVDEACLDSHPLFEANKATLLSAFGADSCTITTDYIICSKGSFYSSVYPEGNMSFRYPYGQSTGAAFVNMDGTVNFE